MSMAHAPLPAETDTIIVGGGTAGAAAAAVLARHGAGQVLLLEAGPDYGPRAAGRWPADLLDARAIPLSHDWGLTAAGAAGLPLDLPRARVIGGCSSHNGCTAAVGARQDYDDWAKAGNPGWSSADVEPLLDWVRSSFRVRAYDTGELTPPQAAFVSAGVTVGLPLASDLDRLEAGPGIGPMTANVVEGTRWNSAFAFLDLVRGNPDLQIAADAPVERLLVENGAVRGVEIRSVQGPAVIRAQRVIVCAGAYHSPALLLRSGIGPATDLRDLGITPVADLAGVGANLLDHACVQLDFAGGDRFAESMTRLQWSPDEQSVGRARSSRCDDGPYDIHVFMVAGANSGHPGLPPVSLYGGAMRARSQGRVRLREAGPAAPPVIEHRYGTDPDRHDTAVLGEALDLLRAMAGEPGLAKALGPAVMPAGHDPLQHIVSYCHPAGTCRLGPASDPGAVVASDGGVHGVPGLYVADASVMPSITRGNINLPTAMIGARVAAGLLGLQPRDAAGG
jgi:choline dehydrogenase